jgi:RimJ/RimL family protein N-acetyltransferase
VELSDGRLILRPPQASDVEWVVCACRDPEIQRWLPLLPFPYEHGDAEWWIDRCKRVWVDQTAAPFIIVDAAKGARLGTIELRTTEPADIGYWLAPEGRGRGAMTDALRLLILYAFEDRGLPGVELFTLLDNTRSQAVARRAGFRQTGIVPGKIESRDGAHHDALRFVLEAPQGSGGGRDRLERS